MASARNEAPRGVGRGYPPPNLEKGLGRGYAPPHIFLDFLAQNSKFSCILEANFIAVGLSYTHKPVSLKFGM